MIDWLPSFVALIAAGLALSGRTNGAVIGLLGVVASEIWKDGTLAPCEPLAIALIGLAIAPVLTARFEQSWLAITIAGALAPHASLPASVRLSLVGVGLIGVLASNSQLGSEKAISRYAVIAAIWLAAITLVDLVLPQFVRGGPVDDLAASRGRVPMALALGCGLCLWPAHSFLLAACRTGSAGAVAVLPILGLVTMNEFHLDPLIREAVVGDLDILFVPLGLATLCVGAFAAFQEKDLRVQLVAAQIGLAGWSATLWFLDSECGRLLWATAAVASTVVGAVIGRLEFRYGPRDCDALQGLAKRHPMAAVVIGFATIVLAKAAVGPLAMTRGLPALGGQSPMAVVVVLIASLMYAAAFAGKLNSLLFGSPQFPSPRTSREVNRNGQPIRMRPLVGPITLLAWGIPLVFVIVISVLPYQSERPQSNDETAFADVDMPVSR